VKGLTLRRFVMRFATYLVAAVATGEGCGSSMPGPTAPNITARPPTVAGTYRLTITASDTCEPDPFYNGTLGVPAALPAEARSRTYIATITQDGAHLLVTLSGAQFELSQPVALASGAVVRKGNAFAGEIPYNGVSFRDAVWLTLRGGDPGDLTVAIGDEREWEAHDLLERIAPTTLLGISGSALGPLTFATIDGTLDGTFWLYSYSGSGDIYASPDVRLIGVCKSPAHRFVFQGSSTTQPSSRVP
jgi:hypothetical protein